jgi:hypothetical protein
MEVVIAEARIPILLGGKKFVMRFSANTMCAYENATGKFFMDTVSRLYEIMFPKGHEDKDGKLVAVRVSGMDIIRRVSMVDLRALLWAAIHEYDKDDEPTWPMTISQVGRQLNFQNIVPIFISFLTGASANSPTKEELGESSAVTESSPTQRSAESSPPSSAVNGGATGIELPAGALD